MSATCRSCVAGDHQHHKPRWGGICIGCDCAWRPDRLEAAFINAPFPLEAVISDGQARNGPPWVRIVAENDVLVAVLDSAATDCSHEDASVLALEIVRRVNLHDELVRALKRVGCQDAGSCGPDQPDGRCFVCAAIAKAEGKRP